MDVDCSESCITNEKWEDKMDMCNDETFSYK